MFYIILVLCSVILQLQFKDNFGFNQIKPKLCINCKHFITDNKDGEYGQCAFFTRDESKINFLVNGINQELYYYCSSARNEEDMCGQEGKYYKKKIIKKNEKDNYVNNKYINIK
jgi:hypothetical protein